MKIKITTDTTADVTPEFFEKYGIGYLPEIVNLGGEEYLDTVNVTTNDIEEYVKNTKKLPKSAARSVQDFKDFFMGYLDEGYDAVVFCGISSNLSCITKNAQTAAEEIGNDKVFVVDCGVLSTGTMLLALCALELAEQGKTASEIATIIKQRSYSGQTSFVVETLEYLHKGGRCSMLSMFGANLLKIKPKLQLINGSIVANEKYRGKQIVVLKKYIDDTLALYNNPDTTRCFITHAEADPEVVDEIVKYVQSKRIFKEVIETKANGVIFTHCGRGTLGLLYLNDGGVY
jgi:DegV family protein with EDD domain